MFTRLAVVGVSTFSSQLLFFDIVVRVCAEDKRRENSKSKFQEKKEKICDESFSLSLSLKLGLSLNGAHVPASARSEIVRPGKRTSGVPRFGSSRSQSRPLRNPAREDESLFEQKFERKEHAREKQPRRRRKDARNRGEKPRRFVCATRERRGPLLLLLLVVVVQTSGRVRFTRASLLKTFTNERKIQSFCDF